MEKNKSQKEVWEDIAQEWHNFKQKPSENVSEFLEAQVGNILDLGSGSGRHLKKIKKGKMWLVDFSEKMIGLAKKKAKKEKIPAEFSEARLDKLPFQDGFFDGAICISSLHCLETKKEREKAVKELFRVLKKDGTALVGVWNKSSERFKKSPKERFVRWRDKGARFYYLYEPEEIYSLFEKKGFEIAEKFPPERMISFVARKP